MVALQSKDVVYTLTQLAPVAFHKEHHHSHGTIQRRAAAEVRHISQDMLGSVSTLR